MEPLKKLESLYNLIREVEPEQLSNELDSMLQLWIKSQAPVNSDIYSMNAEELNSQLSQTNQKLRTLNVFQALKAVIQEVKQVPAGIAFDDLH